MSNHEKIKVSVLMLAYNHEAFIAKAIEGVMIQEGNFEVELIIGEDKSTDKTFEICSGFQVKYPNIRVLNDSANLGLIKNYIRTMQACHGNYIALCSGDDYWTDPSKLQLQIDLMESNKSISMSFHDVDLLNSKQDFEISFFKKYRDGEYKPTEIFPSWQVPASSVVMRGEYKEKVIQHLKNPDYFYEDSVTYLTLADYGKIWCLNKKMAVYRIHDQSISNMAFDEERRRRMDKHLDAISKDFGGKYSWSITLMRNREPFDKVIKNIKKGKIWHIFILLWLTLKKPSFAFNYMKYRILNINLGTDV